MGRSLISVAFHSLRVILAAMVMIGIAVALWLVLGIVTGTLQMQTPSIVLASAIAIAAASIGVGAFVSARYITPRSLLHPAIAAVSLGLVYAYLFTRGETGGLSLSLCAAAALVAIMGAALARRLTIVGADRET